MCRKCGIKAEGSERLLNLVVERQAPSGQVLKLTLINASSLIYENRLHKNALVEKMGLELETYFDLADQGFGFLYAMHATMYVCAGYLMEYANQTYPFDGLHLSIFEAGSIDTTDAEKALDHYAIDRKRSIASKNMRLAKMKGFFQSYANDYPIVFHRPLMYMALSMTWMQGYMLDNDKAKFKLDELNNEVRLHIGNEPLDPGPFFRLAKEVGLDKARDFVEKLNEFVFSQVEFFNLKKEDLNLSLLTTTELEPPFTPLDL